MICAWTVPACSLSFTPAGVTRVRNTVASPEEGFGAFHEPPGVVGRNGEGAFGILHLAQVHDAVAPVDHEIDLGAPVSRAFGPVAPGVHVRDDAGDAERPLHLLHMGEADALEGESAPDPSRLRFARALPVSRRGGLRPSRGIGEKLEVEQRVVVHQLVGRFPGQASGEPVFGDEAAFFQFLEDLRERAVVFGPGVAEKLFARLSAATFRQRLHDGHVGLGFAEQRGVEPVEFVGELGVLRDEKPVDRLRHRFPLPDAVPVERDAAHHHVAFENLPPVQPQFSRPDHLLAFRQRERVHPDAARDAVVEPAVVVDHLVDDPARGASADDQQDVLAEVRPTVPEMLQRAHEPGSGRVHPRHLVDKDDLLPARKGLQRLLEGVERRRPVGKRRDLPPRNPGDRIPELGQLLLHSALGDARVDEGEPVSERLLHEEGLSDPPPPEDGDELGFVGLKGGSEDFGFPAATDQHVFSPWLQRRGICLKSCGKSTKIGDAAKYGRNSRRDFRPFRPLALLRSAGAAKPPPAAERHPAPRHATLPFTLYPFNFFNSFNPSTR